MRSESAKTALMAFLRRPSRMMFLRTERAPRLTDARLSGAAFAFFLSTTGDLKRWLAIRTISWLRTSTRHSPVLATPISRPAQITLSFDLNSSSVMSAVAKVSGSNPSSPISAPLALSIEVSNLSARGLHPPAQFQTFYPEYPKLTPTKNGRHRIRGPGRETPCVRTKPEIPLRTSFMHIPFQSEVAAPTAARRCGLYPPRLRSRLKRSGTLLTPRVKSPGSYHSKPIVSRYRPQGVSHIRRSCGTDGVPPSRRPWKTRR